MAGRKGLWDYGEFVGLKNDIEKPALLRNEISFHSKTKTCQSANMYVSDRNINVSQGETRLIDHGKNNLVIH